MNKKFAFTLTEVMITVGIIGVISALTVPTLMSNYQRKALAVQIRKTANNIASAADLLMTEESKNKFSATSGYKDLDAFITQKFKVLKTCESDDATECFASENYQSIDNSKTFAFTCAGKSYVLADSSAVCLTIDDTYKPSVTVTTDVNGSEGPNIAGRDLFMFTINANTGAIEEAGDQSDCTSEATGKGCYDLLVNENNWQMNY